jgi:pyruvoyl-dependent arginine decarboxylase (PvlArgDC)
VATAIDRDTTELSAVDAAVLGGCVASVNLIRLQSVIPPNDADG